MNAAAWRVRAEEPAVTVNRPQARLPLPGGLRPSPRLREARSTAGRPLGVEGRSAVPGRRPPALAKGSGRHQAKELEPSAALFHFKQGTQEPSLGLMCAWGHSTSKQGT